VTWSETRLHRWLSTSRPPSRPGGAGLVVGSWDHDAAVLRRPPGREVLCVDQTIEGVHFHRGVPASAVGTKALGRSLSDLAATAAHPRAVLLAVAAPPDTSEAWLRSLLTTIRAGAQAVGAELVGGDLACTPGPLGVTVTAIGVIEGRKRSPGRDRARPGQRLLLSGAVGGSSLGRHLRPQPRLELARWLHARGATAMMDVSDGLALDLSRLAASSAVAIDLEEVPVHRDAHRLARRSGRTPREHALTDGEDYELLATVPRATVAPILAAAGTRFPELRAIGRIRAGRGLRVPRADDEGLVEWHGEGGWVHGS
jgi:thiamine-monophosphate kinase